MTLFAETDRLAELLRQKQAVLLQMFELGRKQLEYIEAGEMSQLFKVLSAKQRVLANLQGVEQSLDPFREQDPEQRRWCSAEARQEAADVTRRCEWLLSQIMQQEKQSESRLLVRRNDAAEQLHGLHQGTASRTAYVDSHTPVSLELDLSTES
ncbi:MAG TPA: hypothetical protein VFE24_15675 [Pirellulales bacterium]|jgi:hypothetical protein|nr:hypothetical protein [Pirellulales bacterium]